MANTSKDYVKCDVCGTIHNITVICPICRIKIEQESKQVKAK